jgi:hypothetical protein
MFHLESVVSLLLASGLRSQEVERNKIAKTMEIEGDHGAFSDLQPELALFTENARLDSASIQALREQKKKAGGKGKEKGANRGHQKAESSAGDPKVQQVQAPHIGKAEAYKDAILSAVAKASSLSSAPSFFSTGNRLQ